MEKQFKYIEVMDSAKSEIIKRMDVSDKSDAAIDIIEDGMNRNMNHERFFTTVSDSYTELRIF